MKTTIEISDHILSRAKERARNRRITLRSLIEESLAATLDEPNPITTVRPVTFKGKGLSREFDGADWARTRETIYP